ESFIPPHTLAEANDLLREGPIMVQERIAGDNVRAFVVEGEVVGAAEIVSRSPDATDSRRGDVRVRRIQLPAPAAALASAAAGHWGFLFAAVDFMRDAKSGRYVLLECNSAPFFATFEKLTGLEISRHLAQCLLGLTRRSPQAAAASPPHALDRHE